MEETALHYAMQIILVILSISITGMLGWVSRKADKEFVKQVENNASQKADKDYVLKLEERIVGAQKALENRVQYDIQKINEQLVHFFERLDTKMDAQIQHQTEETHTIRLGIHDIRNQLAGLRLQIPQTKLISNKMNDEVPDEMV